MGVCARVARDEIESSDRCMDPTGRGCPGTYAGELNDEAELPDGVGTWRAGVVRDGVRTGRGVPVESIETRVWCAAPGGRKTGAEGGAGRRSGSMCATRLCERGEARSLDGGLDPVPVIEELMEADRGPRAE